MNAPPHTKRDAQRRADQIRAFRAELDALRREGVDPVPADRQDRVLAHHRELLASLSARYDIDRSESERRMSLGMRLASAFGAAAITAAIVSFFYRIWGTLPVAAQVAALTLAPCAAIAAMLAAARRERTLYVASLCAIVACGAFVLQSVMLGALFNLRGSPHAIAAWGAFALLVGHPHRMPVPFAAAVAAFVAYGAALLTLALGGAWREFGRPEVIAAAAAGALAAVRAAPRELVPWGRDTALILLLGSLFVLTVGGDTSLLPWSSTTIERLYQAVAVAAGTAVIAWGVRNRHMDLTAIGSVFTGLFLLSRFVDWWWDWMPKYLFFLLMAAFALGWLRVLGRLRRLAGGGA